MKVAIRPITLLLCAVPAFGHAQVYTYIGFPLEYASNRPGTEISIYFAGPSGTYSFGFNDTESDSVDGDANAAPPWTSDFTPFRPSNTLQGQITYHFEVTVDIKAGSWVNSRPYYDTVSGSQLFLGGPASSARRTCNHWKNPVVVTKVTGI